MRYPFPGFGAQISIVAAAFADNILLDLRERDADIAQQTYLITLYTIPSSSGQGLVQLLDNRNDELQFLPVVGKGFWTTAAPNQPFLERYPVRGPLACNFINLGGMSPIYGFFEFQDVDVAPAALIPLSPQTVFPAAPVTLGRVEPGAQITLYVANVAAATTVTFTFTPDTGAASTVVVSGATVGILEALTRVPVIVGGTLSATTTDATGALVYGTVQY